MTEVNRRYNCWYIKDTRCVFGNMPAYEGQTADAELEGHLCGRVVDPGNHPTCSDCLPVESAKLFIERYIESLQD